MVNRFLLKNYDGTTHASMCAIPRPHHGVQHQSREALWALALLQMRRNWGERDATAFSDKYISALVKTCLLHDSGRKGEGADRLEWEKASASNCLHHLLSLGNEVSLADMCAKAIEYKDNPDGYPWRFHPTARLIRSLLHDADVLEVMRVTRHFDISFMEIFQENEENGAHLSELLELATVVRDIIFNQGDLRDGTQLETSFSDGEKILLLPMLPAHFSLKKKLVFEQAPNALHQQLQYLEREYPQLFVLIEHCAGKPQLSKHFSMGELKKIADWSQFKGASRQLQAAGKYRHTTSGKEFFVKCPPNAEHAKNEVLMAKLAQVAGLNVPDCRLHSEEGTAFIISSWVEGLRSIDDFSKLCRRDLATLYVVSAWLGNTDTVCHDGNTQLDSQGRMVSLDWGVAGRFDHLSARKANFCSTPIELVAFKNPHSLQASSCFGTRSALVYQSHQNAFGSLTDEESEEAVRTLLSIHPDKIDRLVELYGPDKPGERHWLRRTLHERRAWFALRHPGACEKNAITPAELGAIRASGINGFCRTVYHTDVEEGEIRLQVRYTVEGDNMVQATLQLKDASAQRLNSRLGIGFTCHLLQQKIALFKHHVSGISMSDEIRIECENLAQTCLSLSSSLQEHHAQWQGDIDTLGELLERCAQILTDVVTNTRNSEPVQLNLLPEAALLTVAQRFPDRVATTCVESLADFPISASNHSIDRLTGHHQTASNRLSPCLFIPEKNVEITFYSQISRARAFARRLVITVKGETEFACNKVFEWLENLQITVRRPSPAELQEEYLDRLAVFMGKGIVLNRKSEGLTDISERIAFKESQLFPQLNAASLQWERHCLMEGGQRIFYRPDPLYAPNQPHSSEFRIYHDLSYNTENPTRVPERTLDTVLHRGGTLDSFPERTRKGIPVFGSGVLEENIENGAAALVFNRIGRKRYYNGVRLLLKPRTLGRLDAIAFKNNTFVRDLKVTVTDPLALHIKRVEINSTDALVKLLDQSKDDINHLDFTRSISLFDQLDVITINQESDRSKLLETLKKHFDYWSDGRPIEELILSDKYSFHEFVRICTDLQIGHLIRATGYSQFKRMHEINPGIERNIITSLEGLTLQWFTVNNFSFRTVCLDGTRFFRITISCCDFRDCDLTVCEFHECIFKDCLFSSNSKIDFGEENSFQFIFSQDSNEYLTRSRTNLADLMNLYAHQPLVQVDSSESRQSSINDSPVLKLLLLKARTEMLSDELGSEYIRTLLLIKLRNDADYVMSSHLWERCTKQCRFIPEVMRFIGGLNTISGTEFIRHAGFSSATGTPPTDIILKLTADSLSLSARDFHAGVCQSFSQARIRRLIHLLKFIPDAVARLIDRLIKEPVDNFAALSTLMLIYSEQNEIPINVFDEIINRDTNARTHYSAALKAQWRAIRNSWIKPPRHNTIQHSSSPLATQRRTAPSVQMTVRSSVCPDAGIHPRQGTQI